MISEFPLRIVLNTEANFDYPSHWHNAAELVYASEGECTVYVNEVKYLLLEKDILFIAPGDIHSFSIHNSKGFKFLIQFDFSMLEGFNNLNTSKFLHSQSKIITSQENLQLHKDVEYHILSIIKEYEKKDFAFELYLNARILDITVLLFRSPQINHNIKNITNRSNVLYKLDKAFLYIEANYQNNLCLKDVADATGFSEYHFSRIFKEATEKNFHNFLNEYRIKKAEKLFANPERTITQIAHTSGFNSIVTFNRIFKKVKGCSPTDYFKLHI